MQKKQHFLVVAVHCLECGAHIGYRFKEENEVKLMPEPLYCGLCAWSICDVAETMKLSHMPDGQDFIRLREGLSNSQNTSINWRHRVHNWITENVQRLKLFT